LIGSLTIRQLAESLATINSPRFAHRSVSSDMSIEALAQEDNTPLTAQAP